MLPSRALVLTLLIVSLPACKGADSQEKSDKAAPAAAAPAPAPASAPETDAAEAGAQASAAGGAEAVAEDTETGEDEQVEQAPLPASFEQVGVELCDTYVKDYVACIDSKVPEAEREALRRQVFDNIQAWKQMASGGSSAQQGLQTGCRIAREQAKRATQEWGCEW